MLLHLHTLLFIQSFFTDKDSRIFSFHALVDPAEATRLQLEIADVLNFSITLLDVILCRCESVEMIMVCVDVQIQFGQRKANFQSRISLFGLNT